MKNVFLLRVDASSQIGLGHMMRSIVLGQILQDQGCVIHFAIIPQNEDLSQGLLAENFHVHFLQEGLDERSEAMIVAQIAKNINANWIVIDGIQFTGNYEAILKSQIYEKRLLRIVDQPNEHHFADFLLCQNYGAENMVFKTEPYTKKLLGLQYLLLRKEFKDEGKNVITRNSLDPNNKIMVSMGGGGGAADIAVQKLANAISEMKDFNFEVNFFRGKLSENQLLATPNLRQGITFKNFSENLSKEMSQVDFAIIAGGSIMWELIYMKVPFLAVALNEAQEAYIRMLSNDGLCINLGHYSRLTSRLIQKAVSNLVNQPSVLSEYKNRYSTLLDRNNLEYKLLGVLLD